MSDLKWVLEDLVEIGHPEFKEAIERIEAFDARLIEKLRKQLVEDYLNASTPPEELDGIRDSLVDLIQRGW